MPVACRGAVGGVGCAMPTFWRTLLTLTTMSLLAEAPRAAGAARETAPAPTGFRVYFGTYTGGKSRGIYASRLEVASGRLSAPELVAETPSPSFLALHPGGRLLYAVGEIDNFGGKKEGAVSAWALDPATGSLKALNQQSSKGAHPCHLVVDRSGKWVLLANYSGGNVAVLPIQNDGSLGPASCVVQHFGWSQNPQRQGEPHAHSINLDAANRFAVAADLGTDKLMIYQFDAAQGKLEPADTPFVLAEPGSGPRHFAFHPDGRRAFAINELLQTLSSFKYDPKNGELTPLTTVSTLPEGKPVPGNSTAEVQVHPNGEFVYGSNRGHDSIAVFKIGRGGKKLTWVENASTRGKTPRNFGIDPTGRWLLAANQDSDSVVVFAIDGKTGKLTPTGQTLEVGKPVCVKFLALP